MRVFCDIQEQFRKNINKYIPFLTFLLTNFKQANGNTAARSVIFAFHTMLCKLFIFKG